MWALITRDLTTILKTKEEVTPVHRDDLHPDKPYWVPVTIDVKPTINAFQDLSRIETINIDDVHVSWSVVDKPIEEMKPKALRKLDFQKADFEAAITRDTPHFLAYAAMTAQEKSNFDNHGTKLLQCQNNYNAAKSAIQAALTNQAVKTSYQQFVDWCNANNTV